MPTTTVSASVSENDEDMDLLGGMFSAVPDSSPALENASNGTEPTNMVIRDFGKASGMSPRKLLEEVVRSRYASTN